MTGSHDKIVNGAGLPPFADPDDGQYGANLLRYGLSAGELKAEGVGSPFVRLQVGCVEFMTASQNAGQAELNQIYCRFLAELRAERKAEARRLKAAWLRKKQELLDNIRRLRSARTEVRQNDVDRANEKRRIDRQIDHMKGKKKSLEKKAAKEANLRDSGASVPNSGAEDQAFDIEDNITDLENEKRDLAWHSSSDTAQIWQFEMEVDIADGAAWIAKRAYKKAKIAVDYGHAASY